LVLVFFIFFYFDRYIILKGLKLEDFNTNVTLLEDFGIVEECFKARLRLVFDGGKCIDKKYQHSKP
jgi:hypothetical protein